VFWGYRLYGLSIAIKFKQIMNNLKAFYKFLFQINFIYSSLLQLKTRLLAGFDVL